MKKKILKYLQRYNDAEDISSLYQQLLIYLKKKRHYYYHSDFFKYWKLIIIMLIFFLAIFYFLKFNIDKNNFNQMNFKNKINYNLVE